jgi:hypothetical protein
MHHPKGVMSASSGGIGGDWHETVTTAAAGGSSPVTYTGEEPARGKDRGDRAQRVPGERS